MKKVTLNGIDFVKASEVAKEFNYTTDYIGQLCRSKKVNARLIGRSWFVNIPSIEAHREARHQGIKKERGQSELQNRATKNSLSSDSSPKTYLKRVQPPKTRVTDIFVTEPEKGRGQIFNSIPLHYEPDDFSLMPTVENKPKITLLKVSIADSERLKIKSETRKNNFLRPEPLPEVYLSGKLNVTDIQHEDDTEEIEKKSDKRDKPKNITRIPEKHGQTVLISKLKTTKPIQVTNNIYSSKPMKLAPTEFSTVKKPLKSVILPINGSQLSVGKKSSVNNVNAFVYPALGTAIAMISALLILSVEQVGYGASEMINFSLHFSWANLASLSSFLYTPI